MNKQQTIELLQKQLPGFYSVEQVIKLINGIEEEQTTTLSLDKDKADELFDVIVSKVYDKVRDTLNNMYDDDLVDANSAEFSLNGNEIQLDSVDINKDDIADAVSDVCGNVVKEVLGKYIEVSE
jgi:hypothetical protein